MRDTIFRLIRETRSEGSGLSSVTFAGQANPASAGEDLFYVLACARHARVYLQTSLRGEWVRARGGEALLS